MPWINKNTNITNQLKTELQALIAFVCYYSNIVLKCEKSTTNDMVKKKILQIYMPQNIKDEHILYVDQFLEGRGRFRYMIDQKRNKHRTSIQIKHKREIKQLNDNNAKLLENLHASKQLAYQKEMNN